LLGDGLSFSFVGDKGEEDESEKPYVRLSEKDRKHKPFYYGERISKLGKAGKVIFYYENYSEFYKLQS